MARVDVRKLHWPELALVTFGLLFVLALMIRTSSTACHHWKEDMVHLSGAFLAAAGAVEYPRAGSAVDEADRAELRNAARRVLDRRPFGCL
jgi:hypothetical protein